MNLRRTFVLYAIIAVLFVILLHSIGVAYRTAYNDSIQNFSNKEAPPSQETAHQNAEKHSVPSGSVTPELKPSLESQIEQLSSAHEEESNKLKEEIKKLQLQTNEAQKEFEQLKKAEEAREKDRLLQEQNASDSKEQDLKAMMDKVKKEEEARKKKDKEDKKAKHKKLKEEAKERKDYEPLFKKYLANTVDTTGMTLAQRQKSRHDRYEAYMKAAKELSERDWFAESWQLELVYYGCEHRELATFKNDIVWNKTDYVDGEIQPAKDKVLILTANDGKGNRQIGGALEATRENRKEYCNYHGCIEYFVNLGKYVKPGQHAVWAKIASIRDAFENHPNVEWVWWLDTDAIIMNGQLNVAKHVLNPRALKERVTYGRPMHSITEGFHEFVYFEEGEIDPYDIDLVISQDFNGFNAGSFFIRRSAFTEFLMEFWEDPFHQTMPYERAEQDALVYMFLGHERFHKHFGVVPQRLINSYTDVPDGVWTFQDGDLAVHLAGCKDRGLCESHFHKFWNRRIRVPEKYRVENPIDLESMKVDKDPKEKKE